MRSRPVPTSVALVCLVSLTGCGIIPGTGSDKTTVKIWLMKDSASDDFLERFTKQYEKENPDVDLKVEFQEWTGIGAKVNAALEGKDTPEIIEVGNTQVAQYAESDGLTNLTVEATRDLGQEDWLPGLAEPGNIGGAQFGIPWYAANRVVIYNKRIFQEAGITALPQSQEEWLNTTKRLNKNGNQGIYLPGQDWYALAGFIWEEGGELAVERSGTWEGALDSEAALKGIKFYKELQALGAGPVAGDERTPLQSGVFAKGNVAQLIDTPGAAAAILKANPALKKEDLGYFPIPGKDKGKPGAVFTGGSDLIVPERADNRAAAVEVVKALASEKWQIELARAMNYVPNKKSLAGQVTGESNTAMAKGAGAPGSKATPNSPRWADVELKNPIKPYMTAVLKGANPKVQAEKASDAITRILASTL
ncbi:extracellular solute-binding protein [Streptomyces qinzhouensis]|uniref:Extracellular solute-binding protein n=1 Tax=Streptomyces qinzhouensis TaxID=2599401 RepID=A0A5B8JER6_9ACTN|nr:extracellular solute-binding protein [Streptomyces qinzhouensis]QDY80265.1 extracellular solute-binding protein [Streptomyces qinzhouensis]